MQTEKIILLAINFLGGAAVIGSYLFSLASKKSGIDDFWGGTPSNVRQLYIFSMVLAGLGYFAFFYFIFFKLSPEVFDFKIFYFVFLGILLPSSFWMPLTSVFLASPGSFLWIAIRLILATVGIFSLSLVLILISLYPRESGIAYWLALSGSIYFAFHTAFLDMILWPIFFKG